MILKINEQRQLTKQILYIFFGEKQSKVCYVTIAQRKAKFHEK